MNTVPIIKIDIIIKDWFVRFCSFFPELLGAQRRLDEITFGNNIFIPKKHKDNKRLINHASIHIHQRCEFSPSGEKTTIRGNMEFLFIFAKDYLYARTKPKSHRIAYESIRFEQEAYVEQDKYDYLERRVPGVWKLYSIDDFIKNYKEI